ncbi:MULTISPECIES: redoxin family protein [unclassified Bradyrhizobium]|uniref:TlpA family protein disulfide reductase n=1 Tax=unclassified Bradyrhizobium TaxID=2631580 RepID=UPI002479B4C2|nr:MULTISPECIES: redoxin family protein [unclassified Bradyrhizobium]WGS19983.1 redoxin family protein [Bradyrhizobium sp. ISRA463]WGS26840.1 redoxin family protein [Bradyrhizobium sp. ISRA464]
MRVGQALLFLMLCGVYGAPPRAASSADANQTSASRSADDPGYIEEDPVLAEHVGQPAPVLTLKSIDGKSIDLADLYGKRPVYLKLWATYCIPCRVQMLGLRKIFASHGDEMTVIAVNAGVGDDTGKVKQFVQANDLKMPVAIDDGRLSEWIRMDATPVHLVFGRDGRVIFAGHQDGPKLDAAIEQALASKVVPGDVATNKLADFVTLKPGDGIPAIELRTSDGKAIALQSGPASHLRAVYFSATWCEDYVKSAQPDEAANCQKGREEVDKLAADRSIEWLGVMTHLWTTPKELADYEAKMKPRVPLAVDSTGIAFRTFGVKRFPAVALIDTRGHLIKLVEGDPGEFATAISSLQSSK